MLTHLKTFLISLFVAVLLFPASAQAQGQDQALPPDYVYCELIGTARLLSNKVTVRVDFGDENSTKYWSDNRMRDERGRPIVFNSMIAALNYMGADRWEFIQAYVVTEGNQNVYHYLMKKRVADLSEDETAAFIKQRN